MSHGQTSLAQPIHVPGGGLSLSVVGSLSGLPFSSSKSIGIAGPLWVHKKKTVQESVHAARGDLCVQPGANVEEHVMDTAS